MEPEPRKYKKRVVTPQFTQEEIILFADPQFINPLKKNNIVAKKYIIDNKNYYFCRTGIILNDDLKTVGVFDKKIDKTNLINNTPPKYFMFKF